MPIYTRTGDAGETGLYGRTRVPKEDLRVEAYGTVDELNSFLGLLRCEPLPHALDQGLQEIQNTLFEVGSELASEGSAAAHDLGGRTYELEAWIDLAEEDLAPLRSFILPGGHRQAALMHVARTVCRRAERLVWALQRRDGLRNSLGIYLNRLSDLLFVWARHANWRLGVTDVPWNKRSK